ncbi:hypothetical protein, partial [Thermoanaerobacter sp. A7A]|uniref:hypothetical protein n=1 Tax=Thermoanaerobacter sp. A7A TaxID=1350366 RepID=UPI00235B5B59
LLLLRFQTSQLALSGINPAPIPCTLIPSIPIRIINLLFLRYHNLISKSIGGFTHPNCYSLSN